MNIEVEQQSNIAEKALSKRMAGRIKNAFDNCQLTLVGGLNDGIKAKSRQLLPYLGSIDVEQINGPFVNALDVLLLNGINGREVYYAEELGGEDAGNLPLIVRDLIGPDSGVVIRIVMGATEEMPIRALSYLTLPLQMMDRLREINVSVPQLQIIFANNISGGLNGQDPSKIINQTDRFATLARAYVGEFFKEIGDSVVFLSDRPLDRGSHLRKTLIDLTKVLVSHLSSETRDQLMVKGMRYSPRVNNFYAAAHLLVHDIDLEDCFVALFPEQEHIMCPESIISIGGQQEKLFYRIRHELRPHLDGEHRLVRTLQYFTRHYVPPYYMANGGDLSMDGVLSNHITGQEIAKTASYDLSYLARSSNSRGDLDDFFARMRRELK